MINKNDLAQSATQKSYRSKIKPGFQLLIPLLTIGLFQNCSPSGSSSTGASSSSVAGQGSGGGIGGSSVAAVALTQNDMQGTWNQGCTSYSLSGYSANTTQSIAISGGMYSLSAKVYLSGCTSASAQVSVQGSYTLGGLATKPSAATQINFVESSATLTPLSSMAASELNIFGACGFSNWQNGVAKTITGVSGCDPQASNSSQLYSVAEITSGSLFIGGVPPNGDGNVGSSSALRLDTLGTTGYTH